MTDAKDYLTVSALTTYLKRKFDMDPYLQKVYLVGEISNFRLRPNAHQYFSLKDDNAKINAIMFKSAFSNVKFVPEEGMRVFIEGRITVYPGNGSYQIYVDSMQPDGVGALYQAYEQLKAKLAKEGLFDAPKKQLKHFPSRIAVVTSSTGAVIRDIITTTQRRYPIAQLVLFPTAVQGATAADNIAAQIKMVNQLGNFDTLIIGRGGGSIEDLWPFNEEVVARAIFNSSIPVISSVGHETDTTIADLVADVRAATPTAAAELATPVLADEISQILQQQLRLVNATENIIKIQTQRVAHLTDSYVLKQPQRLYEGYIQKVDILTTKLTQNAGILINKAQTDFTDISYRLQSASPRFKVNQAKQYLDGIQKRINRDIFQIIQEKRTTLNNDIASLDHLSPLKIMQRGYTYVTSDNNVVKNSENLHPDSELKLHFVDGTVDAIVKKINQEKNNGK